MTTQVTDAASHRQDKIANAARVIGRSSIRQKVFEAICSGKKFIKTVEDIEQKTDLSYMQIRKAAVVFVHEEMVGKANVHGRLAYRRDTFYSNNKEQILKLARNGDRLKKYPTSYTPKPIGGMRGFVQIIVPKSNLQARRLTVDGINSFLRVRAVQNPGPSTPLAEAKFKKGLQKILGEGGTFKDWGGETDDLFSTRLKIGGKRKAVAFGLKGKATKGKLTPKKMGKNGDQIQRLFRSPADVFMVQYWGEVDSSVHELMEKLALAKSAAEGRPIYYGVIDGQDSLRLMSAYRKQFGFRR